MKQITKETTVGELAASFTDMVIESASKKMVNSGQLPTNMVKANIFNIPLMGQVQIVLKYSINGEEKEVTQSINPRIPRISDGETIMDIGRQGAPLYITKKILHDMGEQIKVDLIKSLQR